ncbi:MAG: hypothetical protein U0414_15700 [Polyangiaceae bacterium]
MTARLLDRGPLVAAACAAQVAALTVAPSALAVDVEVSNDTTFQAYEVMNPWSTFSLERRRITEQLGFSLYHLQGDYSPGKADYTMRISLRLDADPGVNAHLPDAQAGGETDFSIDGGSRYVPDLAYVDLNLMYAYVEGRNLANGWLGFKVGRQYQTDALGWWSFDGGLIRLTTPAFFELEAYGGLEQRGGLPLSSTRFEPQGVWRGSHADFGDEAQDPRAIDYPSYQFAAPAPAFGFAAETNGPNWLHARVSYRRVYQTGEALLNQLGTPPGGTTALSGVRLSSDRLGGAANVEIFKIGGLKGGFNYDLYSKVFSYGFAGLEAYLGKKVTIGADFDYYEPTFDADSIFNWFSKQPHMTATARLEARPTKKFDLSASGGAKVFFTAGDPDTYFVGECAQAANPACTIDAGLDVAINDAVRAYSADPANNERTAQAGGIGQLAGRYRVPHGKFELRSMAEVGPRGRRVGGDLSGEGTLVGGKWAFGGRVSLYNWHDPTREDRDATSFGYVLAAAWKPLDLSKIGVEWEHDYNALVGQRFRVLGSLNVLWIK